jgi:hypothetical protein
VFCDIDEHGHLRVVNYDDVCSAVRTGGKRTAFPGPVAVSVLRAPVVEHSDLWGVKAGAGGVDALEDVVIVLGDAEDFGLGSWDVPIRVSKHCPCELLSISRRHHRGYQMKSTQDSPLAVHANETEESNQCVPHQCNTASLRSTIKEGNLCFVLFQ